MKYIKTCKHCGKEFETNNPQKIYCDGPHFRPCPVCGEPVQMIDNDFSRPPKCCSTKCAQELRKQKFKKRKCVLCGQEFTPRTGVQIVCDAVHTDTCEICGQEFVRTLDNLRSHVTTCSTACTRAKLEKHSLAKYGTRHPMQSRQVQNNFHAAMKQKYGVAHALQIPGKVKQQQSAAMQTNLDHSGVPYACLTPNCQSAAHHVVSKINRQFSDRLNSSGVDHTMEKVIDKKSYDICVEDSKVLIEIDPTYTHTSGPNHFGHPLDRYYHRNKSQLAEDNGYRCIHVFDWDNWDMIINMIAPKNKIFARKCTVYKLLPQVGDDFINQYHLQGSCRGQLLYLGLVYEGELLQVMTFGRSRFDTSHDIELLRLCTKSGTSVVGGASKLFSYATSEFGLHNIISYCDRSKFNGHVYEQMGMTFIRQTPPQMIWSKGNKKITANLLRARGYDQLFGTSYGKGTNNEELMLNNGWLPVYDCGQRVYSFK